VIHGLPEYRVMQRPLGHIVGRFHACNARERPQTLLYLEHLPARPGGLGEAASGASLQQQTDFGAHPLLDLSFQPLPCPRAIADPIPQPGQNVGMQQQVLPDPCARPAPIDHRLEIPTQMGPARLELVQRHAIV
jgi:hypothetical protein